MRRMWGALIVVGGAVALGLIIFAGMFGAATAQQAKPAKAVIRFGYLPIPNVPLFSAKVYDLFEKEGVDVRLVKFTSGPAQFDALQSGSVDTAWGAMSAFYMGTVKGLNAVWVYTAGDYNRLQGLVVPKGSTAKDIRDLQGKKVATTPGSTSYLAHLLALKAAGMTPQDVQFLPLQPPQQLAAIVNANVDGAWMWEPFIAPAVKDGARWIVRDADVGSTTSFGMAANSKWAKDNTEALGRLLRAFAEGQRRFAKDREPTLKEIKTSAGIERDLAIRLIEGTVWYTLEDQLDPKSPVSMAEPGNLQQGLGKQLKEIQEIALWGKVIEKPGDIAGFIERRPAKFALSR